VPPLLNANATIMCSHGGMFRIMPSTPNILVGGAPVLTVADAMSAVPGGSPCPFATAAGPAPCIGLASVTGGMATKVMVNGQPALTASTMFLTIPAGAGAPVPAQVMQPGNTIVQGT
jgi:hypothetical protein